MKQIKAAIEVTGSGESCAMDQITHASLSLLALVGHHQH